MAPRKANRREAAEKSAQYLEDICPARRMSAVNALAELGTAATRQTPALVKIVRNDSECPDIRVAAVRALSMIDSAALVPHLFDAECFVRREAVRALGVLGVDAKAFSCQLVHCLSDKDAQVRRDALRSLGGLGAVSAPHITEVTQCLSDWEPGVQTAAATALGKIGVREGPHIDALIAFVCAGRVTNWRGRQIVGQRIAEAVKTLCKLGASGIGVAQAFVPYIDCGEVSRPVETFFRSSGADGANILSQKLLDSHCVEARGLSKVTLTKLLASCGATAVPHAEVLALGLTDKSAEVRFQAVKALAGLAGGTTQYASALALCLTDSNEAVRVQAAKALGRIGNDAEAQLKDLGLAAKEDRSGAVRAAAGQACATIELLYVVLTLHISSSDTDGMFDVSCTNMAGEEMVSTVVDIGQPMREVQSAIVCELGEQRFKMVLVSGHVLSVDDLDRPVAEFVQSAQVAVWSGDEMI